MVNPRVLVTVLVVVLLTLVITVLLMVCLGRKTKKLDVKKFQIKWLEIENSISKQNIASLHLAIINADKLVDLALRECNFKGNTMGERMKSAQKVWRNENQIWAAHKIRNRLAHDTNVNISYNTARRALLAFKQALKDLGAI